LSRPANPDVVRARAPEHEADEDRRHRHQQPEDDGHDDHQDGLDSARRLAERLR
jgi:hypothetical protein